MRKMQKQPLLQSMQKDFCLISFGKQKSFTFSIVGYDNNQWFLRKNTTNVARDLSSLDELGKQYDTAICFNYTSLSWYTVCHSLHFINYDHSLTLHLDNEKLPPETIHQCFVHVLNNCFELCVEYEQLKRKLKVKEMTDFPVYRYYLNVPFEDKDEAKRLGARWVGLNNTECFNYRWYIPLEDINDIRPLLQWAHPDDHDFLISICKRMNQFRQQKDHYDQLVENAKDRLELAKATAIQSFFKQH